MDKYLTPASIPVERVCRSVVIPDSADWKSLVNGALSTLLHEYNFEQLNATDLTPAETAEYFEGMFFGYLQGTVCMIGSLLLYSTADAPANTLPCDGSTFNRVDYPDLYAVISPIYKIDADHFKTPAPTSFVGLNWRIVAR